MRPFLNWEDRESWSPLFEALDGHRRKSLRQICDALMKAYAGVITFHGARPEQVDAYYSQGLRRADHRRLTERARRIFLTPSFPEITEPDFQTAVSKLSGIDDAVSYVVLDRRELLEHCGHYLIYGSEHICGIAAQLSVNGRDYRQVLKQYGKPTLFRIRLVWPNVCNSDFTQLATAVKSAFPRVRKGRTPPVENFTFLITSDLPPAQILDHEHPNAIRDPLLPMHPVYHWESIKFGHQRVSKAPCV